jgi:NAD(P)-dependent dehydrogenase (short-subunit alcohol dehydrogenase family)
VTQQLKGKTAVIYGAGGAIGSAVAGAFAAEGASVHLTGHAMAPVQRIADGIEAAGHEASAAVVDALDEAAVEQHLDQVTANGASIDISFNAVGFNETQGVPLIDLALRDFLSAITKWSQTVFLTSRAAARRMTQQGSGVILTVQPPAAGTALASGFGAAVAAVESVALTLAAEVGPQGVRVLILQPNALPQSASLQESFRKYASGLGISKEEALADFASTTMLKRLPTLEEFSDVAVFAASSRASALTGSVIKIDCGM